MFYLLTRWSDVPEAGDVAVLVPADEIRMGVPARDHAGSLLYLKDGSHLHVRESLEDIWRGKGT